MDFPGRKPEWLTFDCYGTLIQWDEGLVAAIRSILATHSVTGIEPAIVMRSYDRHEHRLEQQRPHRSFRVVAAEALDAAMKELGIPFKMPDVEILTTGISKMPPFPEVVSALGELKSQGLKLCIISNTDDDIIAGNVAQMGGYIDRVVTAQQAQAYKPSRTIFNHAYKALCVTKEDVIHICASPELDHVAAREIGFRCIWIDRGTGRQLLQDYEPDRIFSTLDKVSEYFKSLDWH